MRVTAAVVALRLIVCAALAASGGCAREQLGPAAGPGSEGGLPAITQTAARPEAAQSPPAGGAPPTPVKFDNVLFDYREERAHESPAITPEREREILRAVYGAKSAAKRAVVKSAVAGSFTAPHAEQTAYLLQPGGETPRDTGRLAAAQLVVFDGGRLVARSDVEGADLVVHSSDLNDDAVDELLIQGGAASRGVAGSTARLVELSGGRVRVVEDFGEVYEDSCGAAASPRVEAAVIRYGGASAGGWPEFETSYFTSRCPSASAAADFRPAADRPTRRSGVRRNGR